MKINSHGKQNTPAERGREGEGESPRERESKSTHGKRNTPATPYLMRRKTLCTLSNKYFLHTFLLLLLFFQEDNALHLQRRILAGIIVHLTGLFCFYSRSLLLLL